MRIPKPVALSVLLLLGVGLAMNVRVAARKAACHPREVNDPYFTLVPGTTYAVVEGEGKDTGAILGVRCVVVRAAQERGVPPANGLLVCDVSHGGTAGP